MDKNFRGIFKKYINIIDLRCILRGGNKKKPVKFWTGFFKIFFDPFYLLISANFS